VLCVLQTVFQAYDSNRPGPLNGMLISTPYVTKDLLQAKRFKVHDLNTTYVYDFPEMTKQALSVIWKEFASKGDWGVAIPDTLVRRLYCRLNLLRCFYFHAASYYTCSCADLYAPF